MKKTINASITLVQNYSGEVLLLEKQGTWGLPGGKYDAETESPLDGAIRELKEETGIQAAKNDLQFVRIEQVSWGEQIHLVSLYKTSVLNNTPVVISKEHTDYKWVSPLHALTYLPLMGYLTTSILTEVETGVVLFRNKLQIRDGNLHENIVKWRSNHS